MTHVAQFRRDGIDLSGVRLSPDMTAMYCLPPTSKVIGGALIPAPTLIFHSLLEARVVISHDRAVREGGDEQPARGGQRGAVVRIRRDAACF